MFREYDRKRLHQRRVLEDHVKRPSGPGMKPEDALRLDKIVVFINWLELESSALLAKNPEMFQSRMLGNELLVEDDLSLIRDSLYGNIFADAVRITLAALRTAVDPVILVREDVLVLAGTINNEARELWRSMSSHGAPSYT